MHIRHRTAFIIFQIILSFGSLAAFFWLVGDLHESWPRTLSAWTLLISFIYFLINTLVLLIKKEQPSGKLVAPMFFGMILVSLLTAGVSAAIAPNAEETLALPLELAIFTYIMLPALLLICYILFIKKGIWRPMDPFYWVALPATYLGIIIFTASYLPVTNNYLYPLPFFNYNIVGFPNFLTTLGIYLGVLLGAGYALFGIDRLLKHLSKTSETKASEDNKSKNA